MDIAEPRKIIARRALVAEAEALRGQADGPEAWRQELAGLLRGAVAAGRDEIQARFRGSGHGLATVREHAFLLDQVLAFLVDAARTGALVDDAVVDDLAVLAVGGYGRREVCPHSDVDVLFLTSTQPGPATRDLIQFILYVLWDLNFTVGHAVRSVDECVRAARSDWTIATNLLDQRFVYGNQKTAGRFRRQFRAKVVERLGTAFVQAKVLERDRRHIRMGDTRYVNEPNLKEGKGGLRDLHLLRWIVQILYGRDDMRVAVEHGLFSEADRVAFERALQFLLSVRCHLHFESGRAEERVMFDLQPPLAERMGYRDRPGANRIERFMKHYFLTTKRVGEITGAVLSNLREQRRARSMFGWLRLPARKVEGFEVRNGEMVLPDATVFDRSPIEILKTFRVAAEHGLLLHPALRRELQARVRLIDGLRADVAAGGVFLDLLASTNDPEPVLRQMAETGVLGRFVPDFGRVVAQTQHDMYHVYTVDEHTIRAVGMLSAIERGTAPDDLARVSRVARNLQSRRVLYLAVFLHDIAKGRGGDHSILGAEVAHELGPRLGLDAEETETVAWLVLEHLYLSGMAFKRDVQDPQTVADIVAHVQSPERLRLLYVLTACDIAAVGPGVWTRWKADLLEEAFDMALAVMQGASLKDTHDERIEQTMEGFRAIMTDWPAADVDAFVQRCRAHFWAVHDSDTLARIARAVRAADQAGRPLALDWHVRTGGRTAEITVYAPDQRGQFARIVAAITLAEVSVADAKVMTSRDGMAMDTFLIEAQSGAAFDDPRRIKTLLASIEKFIRDEPDVAHILHEVRPRFRSRTDVFRVAPRVRADNDASATRTVIEIEARDQPGLLLAIAGALLELGVSVSGARVSTYGERAIDVFYVQNGFGGKITEGAELERVRQHLLGVLSALPGNAVTDPKAA